MTTHIHITHTTRTHTNSNTRYTRTHTQPHTDAHTHANTQTYTHANRYASHNAAISHICFIKINIIFTHVALTRWSNTETH